MRAFWRNTRASYKLGLSRPAAPMLKPRANRITILLHPKPGYEHPFFPKRNPCMSWAALNIVQVLVFLYRHRCDKRCMLNGLDSLIGKELHICTGILVHFSDEPPGQILRHQPMSLHPSQRIMVTVFMSPIIVTISKAWSQVLGILILSFKCSVGRIDGSCERC